MKRIKTNTYLFMISFIITSCILLGITGVCTAYENMVRVSFGEYKHAVEIKKDGIRFLDFEFNF